MKKDQNRNGVPYPIYPPYQGMTPMMPNAPMMPGVPMMGNAMPYSMNTNATSCSAGNTSNIDSIKEDVENLKKRVNYLENALLNTGNTNYTNNYNPSNYQVM